MTDISKLSSLFDKLANDDAFRARLQSDPASALKEIGVNVPPGLKTGSISLPSKDEVKARQAEWLKHAQAEPTTMAAFFFLK